jgi:hypothetical protein
MRDFKCRDSTAASHLPSTSVTAAATATSAENSRIFKYASCRFVLIALVGPGPHVCSSERRCPTCKAAPLGTSGYRSLICGFGGDRILRRNLLCDAIFRSTLRGLRISPSSEGRGLRISVVRRERTAYLGRLILVRPREIWPAVRFALYAFQWCFSYLLN